MMRQYIQITVIAASLGGFLLAQTQTKKPVAKFQVLEATIDDIHAAMGSGKLTARQLVQAYFERIVAFDKQGPALNCIINPNPQALEEADKLDAAFKRSGKVGPLHGIPVLVKGRDRHGRHADDAGDGCIQGLSPGPRCIRRRSTQKSGCDRTRQDDPQRIRRRRHVRFDVRRLTESLRSGTHSWWLIRRFWVRAGCELLDCRARGRNAGFDSAAGRLERRRRPASDTGPCEPQRYVGWVSLSHGANGADGANR